MPRAHLCLPRSSIAAALAVALAVAAAPAAAAGYLKFDGIGGEAASSDKPRIAVLEVQSWSWGASQSSGKVSKVESIAIKQGTTAKGKVEYEWKVEEGESAPPGPGGMEDIRAGAGEPPTPAASGTPTGKRQHKPLTVTKEVDKATPKLMEAAAKGQVFKAEPGHGSGSLAAVVPAGMCRAGARHATAEFGTGSRVYKLENVVVASCSPAPSSGGGDRPMESISLNFERIR